MDDKIEVKFVISKKSLKVLGLVAGIILLMLLPGGAIFLLITIIIALLWDRLKK